MIKVDFGKDFNKEYKTVVERDPELKDTVPRIIKLFKNNPEDTRLRNHALRKKMKGKHAFSITSDIRIVYEKIGKNTARFLAIGTQ